MDKILTVVIPVYKVELYIRKCLESLIVADELMRQLEVIVINDGTPDNSAIIAKEYEEKYPDTFRVIDKANGGHGSCCNKGLLLARGKYIHFLDSDDWFDESFDVFLNYLKEETADVVLSKHVTENIKDKTRLLSPPSTRMVPFKQYDVTIYDRDLDVPSFNLWGSTFRTQHLRDNGVKFVERVSYDDSILFLAPIPNLKSIVFYDLILYHYLVGREGQSMDRRVRVKKLNDMLQCNELLFSFYEQHKNDIPSNQLNKVCLYTLAFEVDQTLGNVWILPYKESRNTFKEILGKFSQYQIFKSLPPNFNYNIYISKPFFYGWIRYRVRLWYYCHARK